jgi:hypothetical protein
MGPQWPNSWVLKEAESGLVDLLKNDDDWRRREGQNPERRKHDYKERERELTGKEHMGGGF